MVEHPGRRDVIDHEDARLLQEGETQNVYSELIAQMDREMLHLPERNLTSK